MKRVNTLVADGFSMHVNLALATKIKGSMRTFNPRVKLTKNGPLNFRAVDSDYILALA